MFTTLKLIKKHKFIILIILLSTGCIVSFVQMMVVPAKRTGPFGIGLPAPLRLFKGEENGFSIKVPESWNAYEESNNGSREDGRIASVLIPGRSFPHVFIYEKVTENGTLNEVAEWGRKLQEDRMEYQEVSIVPYQTSNGSGFLREYTWSGTSYILGKRIYRCFDWYILKSSHGFVVVLCSDERDWARVVNVFQEVIQSFTVE